MVSEQQVFHLLSPWVGSALLQVRPQIVKETQKRLNSFVSTRDKAADLRNSLEGYLYSAVQSATEGDMRILLDSGDVVRMENEDFPVLADELLYLVFDQFPTDAHHMMLLRDYSLRENSLSAIRALYLRFADYETEEERKTLARVARESHPAFRWKGWLKEETQNNA